MRIAPAIARLLDLPEAQRTLGAFRLVKQLGKGGFAPVWLAKEVYGATELRTVAIKLFDAESDPSGATRGSGSSNGTAGDHEKIVEEARALCRVEHPNVVRFYSMFHDVAGGVIGLVMEYVHGKALDRRIEDVIGHAPTTPASELEGPTLALDEVLAVGIAVASALSAVHQVGLVHRDVKPANIVEADGVHKLIDFGIAAAERRAVKKAESLSLAAARRIVLDDLPLDVAGTKASMLSGTRRANDGAVDPLDSLTGTMGYIDPRCLEMLTPATPASDLYSLGATLYECVTGGVPAATAARVEGVRGLKGEVVDGRARPPPIAKVALHVPASLARLIDALVDPDPSRRPRSAEAVAWELERIRREIVGHVRPLPPESVGPFRGLGRFEGADRDVYFGRAVEIAAGLEMIRSRGVLALVGPSGSGKSSLARAGVLPAIADSALGKWPKHWDTVTTVPGADPRAALTAALSPFVPDAASRSPESLVAALADRAQTTERGLVLLVDQLEELVTLALANPESQAYAVQFLAALGAQAIPGVRGVVAARRDLLDPLLALGDLGRALTRGTLLVSPMSDATWGDVVDQALAAYGYELEDAALRTELLAQLRGTASAMPLVQFALTQLWERRDTEKKRIPRAALERIGGIAGALEMHADATLVRAASLEPRGTTRVRDVLLALTTAQGTRATRLMTELARRFPGSEPAIAALEEARLVVREVDGLTLAHEALLTQWGMLKTWIEEAREDRVLAEAIEREAAQWRHARDDERLWKRRRLVAAEDLAKRGRAELTDDARAFIRAGRSAERRTRVVLAIVGSLVLGAAAAGTALYVRETKAAESRAVEQARVVEEQRAVAESEKHTAQSEKGRADNATLRAEEAERAANQSLKNLQALVSQIDKLEIDLKAARTEADRKSIEAQLREARSKAKQQQDGAGDTTAATPAPAAASTAKVAPVPPPQPTRTRRAQEDLGDPP